MFAYPEPLTVVNPGVETDRYSGETRESWASDSVTRYETAGGVEPRPSQEPGQDARNAVVSGFTLYIPDGSAPVTARSRIEVRGGAFQVQGEPADWRSPFTGWAPGLVVQVERTEG